MEQQQQQQLSKSSTRLKLVSLVQQLKTNKQQFKYKDLMKLKSAKKILKVLGLEESNIKLQPQRKKKLLSINKRVNKSILLNIFCILISLVFYFKLHTLSGFTKLWLYSTNETELSSIECTIGNADLVLNLFNPPTPCDFCSKITTIERLGNISRVLFEQKYAYSAVPVIITDAMLNWNATITFSYNFFKNIYTKNKRQKGKYDDSDDNGKCLFFPYSTPFTSIHQVFNMSLEEVENTHWYVGWSVCGSSTIKEILRQLYLRPYFLPEASESTLDDWIFMGTPGEGAALHIDNIFLPSWQGQVKGTKRWFLHPPLECTFQCSSFTVELHSGEIIVLDTNKWYHATWILPGELSISIGSEYD